MQTGTEEEIGNMYFIYHPFFAIKGISWGNKLVFDLKDTLTRSLTIIPYLQASLVLLFPPIFILYTIYEGCYNYIECRCYH